jgi:hypothetical protein
VSGQGIYLGDDIEIYIDEPVEITAIDRPYLVTSVLAENTFDGSSLLPNLYAGSVPLTIGHRVYWFYYQLRVKRVLDALDVYSAAVKHIEQNGHLYDARLAYKAIEVLRQAFYRRLR